MVKWAIGQRVRCRAMRITEGGGVSDPAALFPDPLYIHASYNDRGTILHVDEQGCATVRFDRTGTATLVSNLEIAPLAAWESE